MAGELIGREIELDEALTAFATLPALVALEGEAGIGKTSVWRAVLDQLEARDNAVLSARPAEAETHLSYAGLADLLGPVLDDSLGELPGPQRQALEAALLRAEAEGRAPDQAAIAFAVLGTLRNTARDRRLIVAVDDLQWLDAPSLFALEFAVRRLRDESVGVLLALRRDRAGAQGSSIEFERWLPDERVRRIGLGPLSLGEKDVAGSRRQLDGALGRLEIEPDLVTVFGGVVEPARLRFPFTRMPKTDARVFASATRASISASFESRFRWAASATPRR